MRVSTFECANTQPVSLNPLSFNMIGIINVQIYHLCVVHSDLILVLCMFLHFIVLCSMLFHAPS